MQKVPTVYFYIVKVSRIFICSLVAIKTRDSNAAS
jgi:hypothetical protein